MKCAARVLPCLPLAVPMETKLRQNLPQLRRGRLAERHPNPLADNLGEIEQTRIAGFQKFQNFRSGQRAVFLPRLGVNRQTRIFFLNCALRCRCCLCRNTISGVGQEPFIQFFGSFHNLFFTELTRVCRLSPFTKKRNRQPSPVEVVFRRSRERAGWSCGDAVRVRGRRRRTGKRDLNNTRPIERSEQINSERRPLGDGRGQASGMGGITDNNSCVPIRASKADTQPRNEVRSVVSAGPSCQRRREASNHSPGLLDSFPGAVAPVPAKFSDSTLMERSGKAGRQWGDRAAESSLARSPAAGCQTNLVLSVSSVVSVRCNVACEMEAVRKWPISRLFLVSCPDE